jgi:hypothetical protein
MPGSKLGRTVTGLLKIVEWFFYFYWLNNQSKLEIWFLFKQTPRPLRIFYRYPRFLKISILHGISTLLTLAMLPPYPETPPIAVPIVWAASLGTAITIYTLVPALKV